MNKQQLIQVTQERYDELAILCNTNLRQNFEIMRLEQKVEELETEIQVLKKCQPEIRMNFIDHKAED
jgi:hypothetical protein